MDTVKQLEYIKTKTRKSWKEIADDLNIDATVLSQIRGTGTTLQKFRIEKLYNKTKRRRPHAFG